MFERLAEKECSHYELLQAEKDALSDNYEWFDVDSALPMEHRGEFDENVLSSGLLNLRS